MYNIIFPKRCFQYTQIRTNDSETNETSTTTQKDDLKILKNILRKYQRWTLDGATFLVDYRMN